jgi:Zn-finger nucleic acid-binding protein/RNA polymerase subunit RPABC4/transcription elongation factor Spt4
MPDARGLHCPNCGAAADPDAGRCPYCKARLATVSCPSCFALLFDGAAFCPTCGARRSRVEAAADQALKCPGCGERLARIDVGSASLQECAACDGVWVDAEVFERLCADKEAQAAVLHRPVQGQARTGAKQPVRYRRCARCGTMMNRVNFGRLSGAVVDVCKKHGTFLDAGELQQIVTFIHGGGLERARARQIEELREEQVKLKIAEARANAARGKAGPHESLGIQRSSSSWDGTAVVDLISFFSNDS